MSKRWLLPAVFILPFTNASLEAATLKHHYLLDSDGSDVLGVANLNIKGDGVTFSASGGPAGGYMSLAGSDDYLESSLAEGSALSILGDYGTFRPFSVSFWVRQKASQATANTQAVFGMTTDSSNTSTYNTGFETITRESSAGLGLTVRARQGGGGSDGGQAATGYNISDGNWHHVVVVYQEGNRSAYVDGIFRGGSNVEVPITTNPVSRFAIGALLRSNTILDDFNGDIDDFQIYDGTLSALEAAQLYRHPGGTLAEFPIDLSSDLSDVVDPLIGVIDTGSCVPGPSLPNGSIHPSPDTLAASPGGYKQGSPVVGFAQVHPQGSGSSTMSYGNFLVSPQTASGNTESNHSSSISAMTARPYSFRGHLDAWNTDCAVVPAANSAIYEFNFPSSTNSRLYFDAARKQNSTTGMTNGSVSIDLVNGVISGGGTFTGNWNPAPYNLYFYAVVDAKPGSGGTWTSNTENNGVLSASITSKQRLGGWMQFDTTGIRKVRMKIAVSFVSVAQAKAHLDREIPAWDLDGLEATAKASWNEKLAVLQTPGIDPEEGRKLYTSLFHSLVQPRDRSADAAAIPGWPSGQPLWDDQYTLWDMWQTLYPLLSLTHPEIVASNVNGFAARYAHNGVAETAFIQGKDFKVGQGGDEVDLVIGDAWAKQVPGIDWTKVWPLLQFNSNRRTADYRTLGYVPSNGNNEGYDSRMCSGSSTLFFSYEDWCTAQVARGLGYSDVANQLQARSKNWKNVWDSSLTGDGFSGFVRAKTKAGAFSSNGATSTADFYQGSAWNYSFNVHHQPDEMIDLMGGHSRFIQRLEFAYGQRNSSYIDFTNEPCFQTIWLFSHAGRPYLASYWADQLRQQYGPYSFTGDEDSGAMSSLYFFLTAGFFPAAGQDHYYLHGSRVPRIEFHPPGGKTFTVTAANSGGPNLYVQSATLNGQPLETPVIHHSDILAGGTLAFVMGPYPSAWSTGTDFTTPATHELVMPVSGPWLDAATGTQIAGGNTASPTLQSGTANSTSSAFTPVTLDKVGDSLTLSAKVSFDGSSAENSLDASRFAWGIFNANGQPGVNGWTGYLASNDVAASNAQNFWKKPVGNTSTFASTSGGTALAGYNLAPGEFSAGTYRLVLNLSRAANGALDYQAALIRTTDGVLVSAFTGSDLSPVTYSFDHVGFRTGNDIGAGAVSVTDCKLTSKRNSYLGRDLVIPDGAVFYWDGGDLSVASITNRGALVLSGGSVKVTGDLDNTGVVSLKGSAGLGVSGSFVNDGTIDTISSNGTLDAAITGNGVILDLTSIRQNITASGPVLTFTLQAAKGHFYQLQKDMSGELTGPWEDTGEPFAGTGETLSLDVDGELDKVSGFFRFAVDP